VTETLTLPDGFADLAPFAAVWGKLETQEERYLQRQHCKMEELKAFYDATAPRLNAIFDHLDAFPMDGLPEPEALLYRTALGLTEAAMAIEVFGQPCVPYAPFPHKMAIKWSEYLP
jgi:hypothetical protein